MEDHVFRRNNLEILGGSQYKEKGFSEGDYYPKCNFLKGLPQEKFCEGIDLAKNTSSVGAGVDIKWNGPLGAVESATFCYKRKGYTK